MPKYFLIKHETMYGNDACRAAACVAGVNVLNADGRYVELLATSEQAIFNYREAHGYIVSFEEGTALERDDDDMVYTRLFLAQYHFYIDYASPELRQRDLDAVEERGYFVPKHCTGNVIAVTNKVASARNLYHAIGVLGDRDYKNTDSTYCGRYEVDIYYINSHCFKTSIAMAAVVHPQLFLHPAFQSK